MWNRAILTISPGTLDPLAPVHGIGATADTPDGSMRNRCRDAEGYGIPGLRTDENRADGLPRRPTGEPRLAAALGERADAADIGGSLGDADDAARVQQIEHVARLDALVVGRQRELFVQ